MCVWMRIAVTVGMGLVGLGGAGCGQDEVAASALVQRPGGDTIDLDGFVATTDGGTTATTPGDAATDDDTSVATDTGVPTDTDVQTDTNVETDTVVVVTDATTTTDPGDATATTTGDVADTTTPDDIGPTGCDGPEQCPAPPACQKATCIERVCGFAPDPQATCDDGNACTKADRCDAGACVADEVVCDDGNACTVDACLPQSGACSATPIVGCVTDVQCVDKDAGTPCNDQDATTVADLCLAGRCAGFTTTRLPGSTVPGIVGVVATEIDHGPDGWSAILWAIDEAGDESWLLARVTDVAAPVPYVPTLQAGVGYAGLRDGFVADSDGFVWQFEGGVWSYDNPWDDALGESGRGIASDLWTTRDRTGNTPGMRRLWVVGDDGGDEWIRYCFGGNDGVVCEDQVLDDFDPSSLPVAVTGLARCDQGGCDGARVALAADASAIIGNYNDTYENADGEDGVWDKGAIPGAPVNRESRAIGGWGDADAAHFLAVGTGGYVVHRATDGEWSGPLALKDGQGSRAFAGVAAGDGLVALVAVRPTAGGQLVYELWTAPTRKDPELASSWTVHTLATAPNVSAAGLYDVAIHAGEVRVVGAIRVSGNPNGADLLDGLMLVRPAQ